MGFLSEEQLAASAASRVVTHSFGHLLLAAPSGHARAIVTQDSLLFSCKRSVDLGLEALAARGGRQAPVLPRRVAAAEVRYVLHVPGKGARLTGEVYEVDDATLARLPRPAARFCVRTRRACGF